MMNGVELEFWRNESHWLTGRELWWHWHTEGSEYIMLCRGHLIATDGIMAAVLADQNTIFKKRSELYPDHETATRNLEPSERQGYFRRKKEVMP